ncbi:DUF485 domain-containing protein (plasmid) [Azospirillum argentinense]|uniref:DUF485 domain-containing protein n=4 Tax=Azospirillum TaxID=191 RepID=A0A4D8PJN9_9PROT|nr:DUF485 domain-containing protein [Azospirillum argentinense]
MPGRRGGRPDNSVASCCAAARPVVAFRASRSTASWLMINRYPVKRERIRANVSSFRVIRNLISLFAAMRPGYCCDAQCLGSKKKAIKTMSDEIYERVLSNPKFAAMTASRARFSWRLALIVLAVYYAFVFASALAPDLMARPLAEGMTFPVGLAAGIVITVFCSLMTGVYVLRANSRYDAMNRDLLNEVGR